ncbi:MAG: DNA protecting protein DprA [Acidocella sp. 20-57-95]|nr:MAG: DNA protecting protein DprA [Acidocella sp. 20-57-95]
MGRFGTVQQALDALPELARAGGRAATTITTRANVEREVAALTKLGGNFIFLDTPDYPEFLADMPDAPPALAVLGDVKLLTTRCVGVVGARNASANGMRMAEQLAADLAEHKLTVVSGLARGIDAAAHKGAMSTGRTIAAIAGGIDCPYPPENEKLQAQIAETGCVVTEAPLGTAPMAKHFPKRNRIIAGLSLGLVVIEAAVRSGSLLTARLGNEAGREIFAVPGSPLDPRCKGSNDLIRQGAHLTETAADVLANLPDHPARQGLARDPLFLHAKSGLAERTPAWEAASAAEIASGRQKIPVLIGPDPVAVDEIARRCQLSTSAIMAVLLELELAAKVEILAGNRVVRIAAA